MTLESAGNTATGTVTIGSCIFQINQSTFPASQGPPAGMQFTANPCQIDTTTGALVLTDPRSGQNCHFLPVDGFDHTQCGVCAHHRFFDRFIFCCGFATRNVTKDIRLGGVHSDAIARFFSGRVYVVNRLGADSIQIIDPQQGFTTPTNGELSVDNGSNPQDIVFVNANKAYVSRLDSPTLFILNPTTLQKTGELNLSSLIKPNDLDGSPEPAYMLIRNGLVYVALQHIDRVAVAQGGQRRSGGD